MSQQRIMSPIGIDRSVARDSGQKSANGFQREARFQVTVVSTTPRGTLAALKIATRVAKNLDLPITLAMIVVLRPHLPLEAPPRLVEHVEKRALTLLSEAGIREQAVTIQFWFCHDRYKCLRQALSPRTLVVVGGAKSIWRLTERKLEDWLCREGYPTVFADIDAKPCTELLPASHRRAILHHVLKFSGQNIASPEGN